MMSDNNKYNPLYFRVVVGVFVFVSIFLIFLIFCTYYKSNSFYEPTLENKSYSSTIINGELCSSDNLCEEAVLFDSDITTESINNLIDYIKKSYRQDNINICFNSRGGDVVAAINFLAYSKEFGKINTCVVDVFNEENNQYIKSQCNSACPILWFSGSNKYISGSSQLGFHAFYKKQYCEYCIVNIFFQNSISYFQLRDYKKLRMENTMAENMFFSGEKCGKLEMSFYDKEKIKKDFDYHSHEFLFKLKNKSEIHKIIEINSNECFKK